MYRIVADTLVAIVSIGAICFLESQALNAGINGTQFGLSMAAVAALGGVKLGDILKRIGVKDDEPGA